MANDYTEFIDRALKLCTPDRIEIIKKSLAESEKEFEIAQKNLFDSFTAEQKKLFGEYKFAMMCHFPKLDLLKRIEELEQDNADK